MNEMIRRAARALAVEDGRDPDGPARNEYYRKARAVIEALRDPTDEMINTADFDDPDHRLPISAEEVIEIWQALIDVALK